MIEGLFVVQHRGTGLYWIRLNQWCADPHRATTFDFEDDAHMSAFIECEAAVDEWHVIALEEVTA